LNRVEIFRQKQVVLSAVNHLQDKKLNYAGGIMGGMTSIYVQELSNNVEDKADESFFEEF
jgi:hypothetical protein